MEDLGAFSKQGKKVWGGIPEVLWTNIGVGEGASNWSQPLHFSKDHRHVGKASIHMKNKTVKIIKKKNKWQKHACSLQWKYYRNPNTMKKWTGLAHLSSSIKLHGNYSALKVLLHPLLRSWQVGLPDFYGEWWIAFYKAFPSATENPLKVCFSPWLWLSPTKMLYTLAVIAGC